MRVMDGGVMRSTSAKSFSETGTMTFHGGQGGQLGEGDVGAGLLAEAAGQAHDRQPELAGQGVD